MKKLIGFAFSMVFLVVGYAQEQDTSQSLSDEEMMALYYAYTDSIVSSLQYETGLVDIKEGMASLVVPDGFKYLNGEDAEMVLTDLWGNPPSEEGYGSLGMLFPVDDTPLSDSTFAIDITYSEEGYIDDSDAKDIDYDDLLETMIEDTKLENEQRIAMEYPSIELIGWASPPFYDETNKKLHWAKELKFDAAEGNVLNYNIRILGRKGYLNLNVIGDMFVLPDVKQKINPILTSVEFNEGYRYEDFDSSIDEVAAVGIGGLIAGKVLAKAGIFAKLGILLAKFWKIIAVGLIAALAGFRKFFGKKEEAPQIES